MDDYTRSLREMQLEYNKRHMHIINEMDKKHARIGRAIINAIRKNYTPPAMYIDYKQGLEMPTIGWKIDGRDVRDYAALNRAYKQGYKAWDEFFRDKSPCDAKLLTHPIPKYVKEMFGGKPLPQKNNNTCTFRRFPNLISDEDLAFYKQSVLVQALLGFEKVMGYKYGNNQCILNDSWTVNLRETRKENIMMDSFLRGFGGQAEELKKQWEGKGMMGVEVSEELKDLLQVYTDAEKHLKVKEEDALQTLTAYMKRYTEVSDERKKISKKLENLKAKLAPPQCQGCGEEDEDEGDDE